MSLLSRLLCNSLFLCCWPLFSIFFFSGALCLSFSRRSLLDIRRLTTFFSCRLWRSSSSVIRENQWSFQLQSNQYDFPLQTPNSFVCAASTLLAHVMPTSSPRVITNRVPAVHCTNSGKCVFITLYLSFLTHWNGVSKLRKQPRMCITSFISFLLTL